MEELELKGETKPEDSVKKWIFQRNQVWKMWIKVT